MTTPVSVTGRVTVAPIYKTSKRGSGYCQFAIADERLGVTSCMAFDPLAKALAGTFPLVDQWITVTGYMKDSKLMAERVVPKEDKKALEGLKKVNVDRAEKREPTQVEGLMEVLGPIYVAKRMREWLRVENNKQGVGALTKRPFDIAGYKKLIEELFLEALAVHEQIKGGVR